MKNGKPLVLIIGAPRSGSSWLQQMIGAHNEVASREGELTLFSRYIAPFVKSFEKEVLANKTKGWNQGLPVLFNRNDIDEFIAKAIDIVYAKVDTSQAKIILDKHPHYSECVDLINYYLPDSKFIDIVRDGREVALSWHRVSKTEGFGATTFSQSCLDWKKFVIAASHAGKFGKDRYLKVYYNDILENPAKFLKIIFDFCNINSSDKVVYSILESKLNTLVSAPDSTIEYKNRLKKNYIWKSKMTPDQRYIFDILAGDLLIDLGFEKNNKWVATDFSRMLIKLKYFLKKVIA